MYMQIPSWAFANIGQHLLDTGTDDDEIDEVETDSEIVEIYVSTVEIIKAETIKVEIIKAETIKAETIKAETKTTAVDVDETLRDAFVSMFENIARYIHTENNIAYTLAELYA